MTGLLVSVRSAQEAELAIAGGAALVDVKEPSRGSLGRAEDRVIAEIIATVAGRRPVSAALGELLEAGDRPALAGLAYVKWGLAGCDAVDWRARLTSRLGEPGPRAVIVGYADWQCAQAPPLLDVVEFACRTPGNVLLIDTHCKDAAKLSLRRKPTLLDWLSVGEAIEICTRCREAGVQVALAGSLGFTEIELLRPAHPDWFAVRGAVCGGQDRGSALEPDKVKQAAQLLTPTYAS